MILHSSDWQLIPMSYFKGPARIRRSKTWHVKDSAQGPQQQVFLLVFDTASVLGGQCFWHALADCSTHGTLPSPWHCHSSLIRGERLTRSTGYAPLSACCWKPTPTAQSGFSHNTESRDFYHGTLHGMVLHTDLICNEGLQSIFWLFLLLVLPNKVVEMM